jgi:protein TonB
MEKPARQPAAEALFDASAVTLPADPLAAARPAPPLVALSEDPVLLEAISAAALDVIEVIVAPSPDRFIDQLVASGGEMALIDSVAVSEHLPDFLELVHHQFPQLQLLLVGPGNVQHQIGTQMAAGTVFRFVHKPASAQRLKLLLDAALRERQARICERQTRLTEEILRSPLPAHAAGSQPRTGRSWWLSATVGMAVLIAAAGAIIWYSSLSDLPSAAKTAPPAAAPSAKSAAPLPLAAPAPPPSAAASHSTSPTGLTEAEHDAIDRAAAERSERSEKERQAAETEAREGALAEEARRAQSEVQRAEVHELVERARSRIASGALIEPADDSARTYVSAAWERAPDEQEVRAVSMALGDALINSFRKALAAGDVGAASGWLKACRGYRISEAALAQMAVQLDSFQAAQVAEAAAAHAVESAPVADTVLAPAVAPATATIAQPTPAPAPAAGPTPVQASAQILQEGDLHRIEFNPPKYPPEALLHDQTGTVELDFTLTPAGTVTDIKVTKSDPSGVFEQAAMAALARNRYEPVERDGRPVAQRAHIRMRFAL